MAQNETFFSPFGLEPIIDVDGNPLHDIDTTASDTTLQNKLKLLYVYDALMSLTDSDHLDSNSPQAKGVTLAEISKYIADNYHLTIDRKSFYPIISALQASGVDIVHGKGKYARYYINNRLFSLAELKLIAGAIAACKILDKKQADELIGKLARLTSRLNAEEELDVRSIDTANRPSKGASEKLFTNINTINKAIQQKKLIRFKYYYYALDSTNGRRTQKLRKAKDGGEFRYASPYELVWEDERYYLICHNAEHDKLDGNDVIMRDFTHFRVDRMKDITIIEPSELRPFLPITEIQSDFNITKYMRSTFSMYGSSEETRVTISFPYEGGIVSTVVDKFGADVKTIPDKDNRFYITVPVRVSQTFFSWIMQFGGAAEIVGPKEVRDEFIRLLEKLLDSHKADKK